MSPKLFVICVAVAVTSLAMGFAAGRVSKPSQVVTRLIPAPRDSRAVTDLPAPEVTLAESGSSRIAVIEPVAPAVVEAHEPTVEEALAALDRALRNRPIGDGSDAEFERKYRDVSLAAAREAMLLLNERFTQEQAAIIAERMAAGQFVERRADDGLGPETRSGAVTMSFAQAIGADGVFVSRVTSFDSKDYPSLHAAQLELQYLQGMMRVPMKGARRTDR